jgi:signal transduction histidine kinase
MGTLDIPRSDTKKVARRMLLAIGAWTIVATFFALQNVVNYVARDQLFSWFDAIAYEFVQWIPWIFLTPLLISMVHEWRLDVGWRPRLKHAVAGIAVAFVQTILATLFTYGLAQARGTSSEDLARIRETFPVRIMTYSLTAYWKYWVVIGVLSALLFRRELREREIEAARLETQLANASLHALRMRLQPHFLFNTLHSVSMLNLRDVDAANRLLVRLSDLLRATLATAEDAFIPLERELLLVHSYLEIEAIRIGDRLQIVWDVDEGTLTARVPTLVLQPLVENAIRHGPASVSHAGRLLIRTRREEAELVLVVEDDGPGLPHGFDLKSDAGVGLGTTSARLESLYGGQYGLELAPPEGGGLRVVVRIPFEEHSL